MMGKYTNGNLSQKHPMTFGFAFSSPAHVIASFLGSGVLRPASGTWGTLAGFLFYILLEPFISTWAWIPIIIVTLFIGAWACQVTGNEIGVHDHCSIVIDEVFAIWMVLVAIPSEFLWQILGFLAFRFFDIIKLQPAKWFDSDPVWHNGMGVMLDDLAAGVQAIILLYIIRYIL
jgi:phosphatidylglycerophosphatase A